MNGNFSDPLRPITMSSYDNEPLLREAHPAEREPFYERPPSNTSESPTQSNLGHFKLARTRIREFLTSRTGHYAILLLVFLDVCCILADFMISLFICEGASGKGRNTSETLAEAQRVLEIGSLLFSCLFMTELVASIWGFGLEYFFVIQAIDKF